jgi:hypothetical protein
MICEEAVVIIDNRAIDLGSVCVDGALDVEGVKGSTAVAKGEADSGLEGPPCGVDVGCKEYCRQKADEPCRE